MADYLGVLSPGDGVRIRKVYLYAFPDFLLVGIERMAGDVEAQKILLHLQLLKRRQWICASHLELLQTNFLCVSEERELAEGRLGLLRLIEA